MKRKSTTKLILISGGAVFTLAICSLNSVRADQTCSCLRTWDNLGSGDWFDPSNWGPNHNDVPDCAGVSCPPLSGASEVDIDNGGTAQISGLTQTAHACETFLGKDSGQSGSLSLDHATLEMCSPMHVGYQGKGTLSIKNGGLVSTFFVADIAAAAGSNGSVTVDGTNPDGRKSTWTVTQGAGDLRVGGILNGAGGTGLLSVTNNGMVNATTVHVYESGTLAGNGTVTGGTTIEGTITPSNGTLTMVGDITFSGHATLECSVTPSAADKVNVSGGAASLGTTSRISVTMTGTTFTAGTTYTLLHADNGVSGRFLIISIKGGSGQCFTPTITYDAHNVYLYLEPCS